MTNYQFRRAFILLVVVAVLLAGCGSERAAPDRNDAGKVDVQKEAPDEGASAKKYTPPKELLPPPEPAEAPPLEKEPAGTVIDLESKPEGMVADPETGLVAVGLRDPDELALVDGDSGEVVRRVKLSGAPRHLGLNTGGPMLVPAELSDTLIRVGLPEGEVLDETPVDNFPHDAAAAPGGKAFVISEAESTAMVVEDGEVAETFETPLNPGGVTVTDGGLVGVVGVVGLALEVFEAGTLDSLGRIDAGEGPTHVEAGPDDRFYVADTRGDALLAYRVRPELELTARVPLPGGSPYGLAVDPERRHLWVTLTAENRLVRYAIDGDRPRETGSYPTVRQPNSVAVNPESGRVFVAGRTHEELQMIDP